MLRVGAVLPFVALLGLALAACTSSSAGGAAGTGGSAGSAGNGGAGGSEPPPPPLVSVPATAAEAGLLEYYSDPSVMPTPLAATSTPLNTYLDPVRNGMHEDTTNSDVTNSPAPLGVEGSFTVVSHLMNAVLIACPTVLFTDDNDILTHCFTLGDAGTETTTHLLDGDTLAILDSVEQALKENMGDASGGGYLHKLVSGELLIGPWDQTIRTYEVRETADGKQLHETSVIDLNPSLSDDDHVTDVVVDYDGYTWFTASSGVIGIVDPDEQVFTYTLTEPLQNQIAIDPTGVYLITHNNIWKFKVDALTDPQNPIVEEWRTQYDNTGGGVLSQGSGTTPTMFGANDEYVAITDNSTPQLHLNVYFRATGTLACQADVFPANQGAVENSPVGYDNSIAIVNNFGWGGFLADPRLMQPGYEKVTVVPDAGSPTGVSCVKDWVNPTVTSATVPMMSTQTGLIYMTSLKVAPDNVDDYGFYFVGIDWITGQEVFAQWVGNGSMFDAALMLGAFNSDGEYIAPTRNGFYMISGQ